MGDQRAQFVVPLPERISNSSVAPRENSMRRNLVRSTIFVFAALALIGSSLLAIRIAVHADTNQRVALSGNIVPLVQHAQLLQATDPSQQLNLSIGLQLRNEADLDSLLSAIYNPNSPQYDNYLTPDQFNTLFAPTSEQVQQVVSYLQSQSLTVTSIAPNNLLIDATGNVAQVQQAFNLQINNYKIGNHVFYSNASVPSVPTSISQLITSISGLNNSIQYHPLYQRAHNVTPLATPSGFGPKELSGAYNAAPLQNAGVLGDNQTVAIFELDGYQQSDVTQYFQNYGLGTPTVSNVLVDGASGSAGSGAIEVELDIEVAAAMAPHANQIIYEGPNTTQGLNDTYNKIVTDNKAQIMSTSWGLCEASSGNAELQTLDNIFKQGAAQGIAFFAAAGDSGAYDCGDGNLAVDSPADDPYVTGVGGTNLQLNAGTYGSESVWSNPNDTSRSPKGAGGGGGFSSLFSQPTWQTGNGVGTGNSGKREVPDVSADADPTTGYAMYCTVSASGCPTTGWISVGGTSASAPLWAGSTALINQYLQSQNKSRIGNANSALYNLFNAQQTYPAFHDITSGNNLFYQAAPGYDMASGIGTPDFYNLARDQAASSGSGGAPPPTPTATSTPTPSPTPTQPPLLIQNGGFENGSSPWKEASGGGYEIIDPSNPHTGQYSAYLCGYTGCKDQIWQNFTVPSSYTKITVTYWWSSVTSKPSGQCKDTFISQLKTASGNPTVILPMQQTTNCNATNNNWVQESYDASSALENYKGKQVTLFFQGTNIPNNYYTTNFYVDDVVLTIS